MATTTHFMQCTLCEAGCGVAVSVEACPGHTADDFGATSAADVVRISMSWKVLALLPLAACLAHPAGDDDDGDSTERDVAAYDALAAQLEQHRRPFEGPIADELHAESRRLYWLEYRGFDPSLASWQGGTRITYGFPTGTEGNYRASDQLVVTATREGDQVRYRAFAANAADAPLDEVTFPAPTDEQRWWAYAVGGDRAFIVTTGAQTTLHRWVPGSPPAVEVVLEQAGIPVGELLDLGVFGNRAMIIESGRLWSLDLATRTATWLGNEQAITGAVSVDNAGLIYVAADGPYYVPHGATGGRALKAEIEGSGYEFNATYRAMHHYAEGATLHAGRAIYKGQSGVFAYDLASHEVRPLLLEPRTGTPRIVYKDPQVLDDGTLFITGLESDSGAVGADGPVYALDLTGSP